MDKRSKRKAKNRKRAEESEQAKVNSWWLKLRERIRKAQDRHARMERRKVDEKGKAEDT